MQKTSSIMKGLAFVTLLVPAIANAEDPFEATPEALSAHLMMNSYGMSCEALGQAAMMVASFSHELGVTGPQNTDKVITVFQGMMAKGTPKTRDMAEFAYIAAIPYVLDNPNIVSTILKASEGAKDKEDARVRAHKALASPCFATSYFKTATGYLSAGDVHDGILKMHGAVDN